MIPIDYRRIDRAVQEINRRYGLTSKQGRYKNRLRARPAREIAERMNLMRENGITWHSSLVHAAAAQKGIGNARRALYRKALSLYGWWMRKKLLAGGAPLSQFYGTRRAGAQIKASRDARGQLGFLA